MKYLLLFIGTFMSFGLCAQTNPYESLGIEVEVLTLSKGKYQEFHDLDSIQQIAGVIFNINTKEVIGFIDENTVSDTFYFAYLSASRFVSVDPLAEEMADFSPYAYGFNNPILFVDPYGMDNIIYLFALQGANDHADPNKVASAANEFFSNLGLKTTVQVVSDVDGFDLGTLDDTDGIAVLGGSREQTADFISNNLSSVTSEQFGAEMADWVGGGRLNPERTEMNGGRGNVIAINAAELGAMGEAFGGENANTAGGFAITHGAGHLAGLTDYENRFSPKSGRDGLPLMYSGNNIADQIRNNYPGACPNCLSDFTTAPSASLIRAMHKRFGNNTPSRRTR